MYKHYSQSISSWVRLSSTLSVLLILALMLVPSAFAQSTTDGAIGGTVSDPNGAVVPGAKVTAHNNGTNAEKSVNTDNSGYYRIIQLQPGSYTVTITPTGFAPYKADDVIVQVGSVTDISPRLAVAGTQESVQVTSEAPQVNTSTPELAQTLNNTDVSNLPINGGRWSAFSLLTPTVVSDSSGFGLVSFRGISVLLNNNTVDGGDNNQAFFSEERGRTRIGYSTPKAAVEEFQVNTSNYSSEYGRSAGGVINTVTKSGTNSFHGETYFYDRDNGWGAANQFTKINIQDPVTGLFAPRNFKPKDWRKITGFGIGGPIIKDKLFFFFTFDYWLRNFPGDAVPSNPTTFFATQTTGSANVNTLARRLNGLPASGPPNPTAAQLNQALATWNTDIAGLTSMLGPVTRSGEQNIFLPKIDWQINQSHHASFSFNRMRWSAPRGVQSQATNSNGIASFGNDFVKDTWGIAKLDSTLTPSIVNEIRYQYGRDFNFQSLQRPTPYEISTLLNTPTFTNPLGAPPQVSITGAFTFGSLNFLPRIAFPDETRHQIADTVNWSHGKHNLKFGVDYSHVNDLGKNLFLGLGAYSYSSLVDYFSDLNVRNSCGGPCYSNYQQGLGPLGFEFQTNDIAFFAQDDWRILPRLSLSLGLRYEYEMLPNPFRNLINPAVPQTAHMPSDKNNLGPRVGFAYDIFGDGRTVVRGGYGIYYGRVINSTIFNALISTGIPGGQFQFFFTPSTPGAPIFPTVLSSSPAVTGPNVTFFDRNFQLPQIHQTDLTFERDLGWNSVFSVGYVGSMGRELPNFVDTNIAPSTRTITYSVLGGGPITASTITLPFFSARLNPAFGAMTDVVSNVNSSYNAMVVQLNHRMSHHIQFSANYTWAHAIDFGQNQTTFSDSNDLLIPGNIRAEKANSIYDVRHRFVLHSVMTSPWKKTGWLGYLANDWEMDPIYQTQTGLPYSLTTSGTPSVVTGTISTRGIGSTANGSGGANRLDFTGRNTFKFRTPWIADVRVAKHFKFQEKYGLELMAEFFNIANKQNATSVGRTGYAVSSPTVRGATVSPCSAGVPVTNSCLTFDNSFGVVNGVNSNFVYSPRQIQLGVRVEF